MVLVWGLGPRGFFLEKVNCDGQRAFRDFRVRAPGSGF